MDARELDAGGDPDVGRGPPAVDGQLGLPGLEPERPPGFVLREDLITPQLEVELLEVLGRIPLGDYVMHGTAARRRVAYFGAGYGQAGRMHARAPAVPAELLPLRARCAALAGLAPDALAQVLVTRYPPGAGIGWHRDLPQFGVVVGVSLAAPCRFRLRRMGASARGALTITLRPRSAYVLAGVARWGWQHFIPPVDVERWSVTFRTLRDAPDRAARADGRERSDGAITSAAPP